MTEKGGDYLLRVKANQPKLHEEMTEFFLDAERDGFKSGTWHPIEDTDGDHGRIEIRRTWACDELSWFADHARWTGLKSVVVQRNTRESKGKTSDSLNIYISSRPAKEVEALARSGSSTWLSTRTGRVYAATMPPSTSRPCDASSFPSRERTRP